jgi:hypothetical protein
MVIREFDRKIMVADMESSTEVVSDEVLCAR